MSGGESLLAWFPADPALRLAMLAGSAVYLVATLQLLVVGTLHLRSRRRERREAALKAEFGPAMLHTIEGLPCTLPALARRDQASVMLLWLFYVESTRGDSRERLRQLGLRLGFAEVALRMLERRALGNRLLATAALGRLQLAAAWDRLLAIVDGDDPVLSVLGLRSLSQLDPAAALQVLLQRLPQRTDWPSARLNSLLRELPAQLAAEALLGALDGADDSAAPRLLQLLEIVRPGNSWRVLERFLDDTRPVDVLAAALRLADDPRALPAVRRLAAHPSWVVRTKAASALGSLGDGDDLARLRTLLGDPVWWVRFRAAQALLRLPGLDRAQLQAVSSSLDDRYARDMLTQMLAETAERP